jgi:hypothetical protein
MRPAERHLAEDSIRALLKKIKTEQNFRNILNPINPNNDLNTKVSGNWKRIYSQNGVFRV